MSLRGSESRDLICIGSIGRTVGLKGHLKVHFESDFAHTYQMPLHCLSSMGELIVLEDFDARRGTVRIQGVQTIEGAKHFVNLALYQTLEQTKASCVLQEDEHFYFDVIGCQIIEDGVLLGVVDAIDRFAGRDYCLIKTAYPLVQKGKAKIFLLPYDGEHIGEVDLQAKTIHAHGGFDILLAS